MAVPVRRDPAKNQERILKAATAEFARHGLGGARVDRIAERAGANKRMLYYYYGNKEALFLAVMEASYSRIRNAERSLKLGETDPAEGIRRLVEFTWAYYLKHPEFLTLLNSENLHQARHIKRSKDIPAMHSPFVATIEDLLKRGVKAGQFRRGVDAVQLYISIASLSYFYQSNRHTLSAVFARDLFAPKHRAERLKHMVELVLGYLRK
ncbi:MAG: TetR/AcrR family transcriptional regulator [Burkholderiales bacterium]